MNKIINPAWKTYKAVELEGGEGYNPHAKWIDAPAAAVKPAAAAVKTRFVRDERGNLMNADKMAARLAKDEATICRLTDASAIAIFEKSISFARAALA